MKIVLSLIIIVVGVRVSEWVGYNMSSILGAIGLTITLFSVIAVIGHQKK